MSQGRKSQSLGRDRGARGLALDILAAAAREKRPVEELMSATLRRHPELLRPERALLLELVQGVKRWEFKLDYYLSQVSAIPLKKLHPLVLLILRLAAYQILWLSRVPARAAVHQAGLEAKARRLPPAYVGFINAVLRRLAAGDLPALPEVAVDPVARLAVEHSHPPWLVCRWLARWGLEATAARLAANNLPPPLTIRVNTLKTDPEALRRRLAQEGVEAEPCRFSAVGMRLVELGEQAPRELPSYREGLWLFQDEAAQLATLLLPPAVGPLLEVGAGRGGKTTHLAERLGSGLILALDRHGGRLRELRANLRRWGAAHVQPIRADAAFALPLREESVDAVLLDVPCSALGILRRHPEIKTRLQEADLVSFPPRQQALLSAAAAALRPGGRLLYITCTTEPAENEELIDSFLETHREFRLSTDARVLPPAARPLVEPPGWFRSCPAEHDLDGFFAVLLHKTGKKYSPGPIRPS